MADNINDNAIVSTDLKSREPDAHGQAAMLLVESLIHALIARSVIGVREAVELTNAAAEVQADIAADLGDPLGTMSRPLALLTSISASLAQDIED